MILVHFAKPKVRVFLNSAKWEESKHPRAKDGKFGKGSGTGKTKEQKEPKKVKVKKDKSKSKILNITPNDAKDIISGDIPIPDGWFVHGRSTRYKYGESGYPTEYTQDITTANQYAGNDGEVWIAKPTSEAKVFDFSDENTNDMDKIVNELADMYDIYASGEEIPSNPDMVNNPNQVIEDILSNIEYATGYKVDREIFEQEIRKAFSPKSIVDSAETYDNNDWLALFTIIKNYPDFIKTPDGAVMLPGAKNIESINLTKIAKSKDNTTNQVKVYHARA